MGNDASPTQRKNSSTNKGTTLNSDNTTFNVVLKQPWEEWHQNKCASAHAKCTPIPACHPQVKSQMITRLEFYSYKVQTSRLLPLLGSLPVRASFRPKATHLKSKWEEDFAVKQTKAYDVAVYTVTYITFNLHT